MLKKGLIGVIAGIISGLFSTGGGMIIVPAFIHLLNMEDTKARGTSVFCILPMVLINWNTAILCAIGGTIGGYFGARLLKKLPEKVLKIAFTVFLVYVSFRMITS